MITSYLLNLVNTLKQRVMLRVPSVPEMHIDRFNWAYDSEFYDYAIGQVTYLWKLSNIKHVINCSCTTCFGCAVALTHLKRPGLNEVVTLN